MDPVYDIDAVMRDGANLLAWDLERYRATRAFVAYRVGADGAHVVRGEVVPTDAVAAWNAACASAGLDVGGYDFDGPPWAWRVSPEAVTVWGNDKRLLDARDGVLAYTWDRILDVADIAAFVTYVEDGYVDRGVKARLHDGRLRTVLSHLDVGAAADMTWSRVELARELAWARELTRALAAWAQVSVEPEATP